MLEITNVRAGYGAINVLWDVSLSIPKGQLTTIVGPNGAGKTTYFNLLSGQVQSSAGRVLMSGEDITRLSAAARTRRGMGRGFQLTNLFPNLTVAENVRIAIQARSGLGFNLFSIWSGHVEFIERADRLLHRVALIDKRNQPVSALSHGDQRKLEVGILLALEPTIFMFDEPTAGMSVDEVPVILDLIHQIKADTGKTVLLVEHKMDVVRSLADRIIVLHNGMLVADGEPDEVIASDVVRQAYLGAEMDDDE